ncbi:hypothetical protein OHB12_02955 [Nocardia sp. NBC_01730]|uniref:hypothetical protein n=1 Tax=Nocardia sp. NBC_01730 TaxID=2975998 RepID=UPI002E158BB2|nr:hypothetical protein OHB12_02955 [Nocardia sp. NBC_01730]
MVDSALRRRNRCGTILIDAITYEGIDVSEPAIAMGEDNRSADRRATGKDSLPRIVNLSLDANFVVVSEARESMRGEQGFDPAERPQLGTVGSDAAAVRLQRFFHLDEKDILVVE